MRAKENLIIAFGTAGLLIAGYTTYAVYGLKQQLNRQMDALAARRVADERALIIYAVENSLSAGDFCIAGYQGVLEGQSNHLGWDECVRQHEADLKLYKKTIDKYPGLFASVRPRVDERLQTIDELLKR